MSYLVMIFPGSCDSRAGLRKSVHVERDKYGIDPQLGMLLTHPFKLALGPYVRMTFIKIV